MSTRSVLHGTKAIVRDDRHVSSDEFANKVIKEAELNKKRTKSSPVTDGEIGVIGEFSEPMFDPLGCFPPYSWDNDVPGQANDFFTRYGAPYGKNEAEVKAEINAQIHEQPGEPADAPPARLLELLHKVSLDEGPPMPGGVSRTAYVSCDTRNKEGRYCLVGATGCFGTTWTKHILGTAEKKPTDATKQQVAEMFMGTGLVGVTNPAGWNAEAPTEETVSFPVLSARGQPRGPYGPRYMAHLPASDPNGSDYFYVSKSDGWCQPPQHAGKVAKRLPEGFFTMAVEGVNAFGAARSYVNLHGEMSNIGWEPKFEVSEPDADNVITVKATAEHTAGPDPVIALAKPFGLRIPIDAAEGNFTIKVVNEKGHLLDTCQLNLNDLRPY